MTNETQQKDWAAGSIRWLSDLNRDALAEAGGKGANLGEMMKAGLPVPPGFVVTTDAYWTMLAVDGLKDRIAARLNGLDSQDVAAVTAVSQSISQWMMETPVPVSIQVDIRQAYTRLCLAAGIAGDENSAAVSQPVAVRSSATAEDLPEASFAGQQETYLHVRGPEAVLEAVQKCWASLWTPQAIAYRASRGYDPLSVALAVVVQVMVPADVAGVMFTANPINGKRDEILISASYGLGESVVSGAVTPDTFILSVDGSIRERILGGKATQILPDGNGTKVSPVPEIDQYRFCLEPADLSALAGMARRVQEHYGGPQDTEWALHDGRLYLLQARPITTLDRTAAQASQPEPEEEPLVRRPPRGIENIMDHMPEPPMPIDVSVILNDAFNLFFEKLGFQRAAERGKAIERPDGRIAVQMAEPGFSPAVFIRFPAHLISVLRKDPRATWEPVARQFSSWIRGLENERLATRSTLGLVGLITRSFTEFEHLFARRYLAAFFPGILYSALVGFWVRRAIHPADASGLENQLYRATQYPTALQNRAMADLASLAREAGPESEKYQEAFRRFLRDWGNRAVHGMVALPSSPTWAEQPAVVARMVAALAANPEVGEGGAREYSAQSRDYQLAKERVERRLHPLARGVFRQHLQRARNALVVREEGLSYSEDYNAFLRRALLQLGGQFRQNKILAREEDIFYLLLPELEPAAKGELADVPERIDRRKEGYRKLLAAYARGQHWLFATGSIPPPPTPRPTQAAGKNTLQGLAASQGEAVGRVRIIKGPEEFGKMQKGEILVAPFTAPAWTPLFGLAAAVVTEIGSSASHAAIVAREYGIPCIVAVNGATKTLRDGQLIHVDGTRGMITIEKETKS